MTNQFLENERIALEEKITEARNKGNENTYKNLIQAYERVLELIRKENKWEERYSKYKSNDKDMISTWEQKGEEIRNVRKYEVKEIYSIEIGMSKKCEIKYDSLKVPLSINGEEKYFLVADMIEGEWIAKVVE